jgi:AcrR family transcriptional regulator
LSRGRRKSYTMTYSNQRLSSFMATKQQGEEVRQQIVSAANRLFYEQGYNHTSFSEIAEAAAVPRGNFYYYFKSKDDILNAVVDARLQRIRSMLEQWDHQYPEPKRRLKRYVDILLNEEQNIVRFGCPMGTLSAELGKTQVDLQARAAEMFDLFLDWLKAQFLALGHANKSRAHALHLLAATQGIALITHVYADAKFLNREAAQLKDWIDSL